MSLHYDLKVIGGAKELVIDPVLKEVIVCLEIYSMPHGKKKKSPSNYFFKHVFIIVTI